MNNIYTMFQQKHWDHADFLRALADRIDRKEIATRDVRLDTDMPSYFGSTIYQELPTHRITISFNEMMVTTSRGHVDYE